MANCTEKHPRFDEAEALICKANLGLGNRWHDDGGCEHVYIGIGGWRDVEPVINMRGEGAFTKKEIPYGNVLGLSVQIFHPVSHLYAYLYKGEWHLSSFEWHEENMDKLRKMAENVKGKNAPDDLYVNDIKKAATFKKLL